jgi:hypothetical protein
MIEGDWRSWHTNGTQEGTHGRPPALHCRDHELRRQGAALGCVAMCAGGGMGSALVAARRGVEIV